MRDASPVRLGQAFRFWLPLQATWLMMSLEGPLLSLLIARLDDPKINLAAYGVAFAFAIIVEAPVILILSASNTLVKSGVSFQALRKFTFRLNLWTTVAMALLVATPLFPWLARSVLQLPEEVARLTRVALLILLPWPGAIGYRRFFQGLLIRRRLTRYVAFGTAIRVVAMASCAVLLFLSGRLPGAWVGACALTVGVCVEALVSRWMAREVVHEVRAAPPVDDDDAALDSRAIRRFYAPLAWTSTISLAAHPVVTFFMGFGRFPLESLAVLPVVNALTFVFRSSGLALQDVALALLGESERNAPTIRRFAIVLGITVTLGLGAFAWTPLGDVWLRGVNGLSAELAAFALVPLKILTILPGLSVLLGLQRAVLMHARDTKPVTWSTVVELAGIALMLAVGVRFFGVAGSTVAGIAYLAGRIGGNAFLARPLHRAWPRDAPRSSEGV